MPKRHNAKAIAGASRPIDPTRVRRAGQVAAGGQTVASPCTLDAQGRTTVALRGAMYDNGGAIDVRVDGETLEVVTGSPPRIAFRRGDNSLRKTKDGVVARPSMVQIENDAEATGVVGADLQSVIARLQTNKLNTANPEYQQALVDIAALLAAAPIARGTVTLVLGTVTVALASIQDGAIVGRWRRGLIGTLGVELGVTVTAGVGFTLTSLTAALGTQVLDVSTVDYVVFNP